MIHVYWIIGIYLVGCALAFVKMTSQFRHIDFGAVLLSIMWPVVLCLELMD
jgi:hypothetical protein